MPDLGVVGLYDMYINGSGMSPPTRPNDARN